MSPSVAISKQHRFNLYYQTSGTLTLSTANFVFKKFGAVRNFQVKDEITIENSDDCNFLKVNLLPADKNPMYFYGGKFEIPLAKTKQLTLTYQVLFEKGFQFGYSGTLHQICTEQCRPNGFKATLG